MFQSVYRVSTTGPTVPAQDVDALARELGLPLPAGYREYLMELGRGELCDFLRVRAPREVLRSLNQDRESRHAWAELLREGLCESDALTDEDVAEAIVFATSAEGDDYFCCPRFGPELFELPRHDDVIASVPDGFVGAVRLSVERMQHDFPFFEPWDERRRRYRGFDVRPGLGLEGFLERVKGRWGEAGLRRSRTGADEMMPNLFIRPIEARFVLYMDKEDTGLPADAFHVVASYDTDAEADLADFVESVLMPGGKSWSN
jgi:hypothetical protein